jgi:hypothetical protein
MGGGRSAAAPCKLSGEAAQLQAVKKVIPCHRHGNRATGRLSSGEMWGGATLASCEDHGCTASILNGGRSTFAGAYSLVWLARCPLYSDSDQVLRRSEISRWAKTGIVRCGEL